MMFNKDVNYGTYFGELKTFEEMQFETNENFSYAAFSGSEPTEKTEEFVKSLRSVGVEEILFDVEDLNDYSDTLFFRSGEKTDLKALMLIIVPMRPHEFSEESPNHFRMWFD
jgi:hypothetical protein